MSDICVITFAGSSFAAFFISHCITLRLLLRERFVSAFIWSFIIGVFTNIFVVLFLYKGKDGILILSFSLLLYALFFISYSLCIFAIVDSSLHLRYILEVTKQKQNGITMKELKLYFNERQILEKRLNWLVGDGVISQINNCYTKMPTARPIALREILLKWFDFLFP